MPTGTTERGQQADGAIILVYYQDKFLMGEETVYLTDSKELEKAYRTNAGQKIEEAFLSPGSTDIEEDIQKAKAKFSELCRDIEIKTHTIKRVTYADFKDSYKEPGYIKAKPRYVPPERRNLYGFPKGSYELKDSTIETTAFRECHEETSIVLNPDRIKDQQTLVPTGRKSRYAVFHYKLTKLEYDAFSIMIAEKNRSRENELHNLKFIHVPDGDPRNFFTNAASKEAYEQTIHGRIFSNRS
jgi:8-oxo-dGTP pyrophosphatase MutT (NUDIX family)